MPASRAERAAWVKQICDRWHHLSKELRTAAEEDLTKDQIEKRVGQPTIRTKEYFGMLRRGGQPSWTYTPDGPDEAWIYEIGGGVMVAIKFNTEGAISAFETTGIKHFLQDLPRNN